jgi:pSer/pThr/pTyr-binding forkhead associated (FHA) protein
VPPRPPQPGALPFQVLPPGQERSVYGLYLVVERGRDQGSAFPLNREVTVIGRSQTDIVLDDPDISRRHAAIDVQGRGNYVLRDLRSTNGTLLNGRKVASDAIADNDKIRMGGTTLKFVVGEERVAAELARLRDG